MRQHVSLISLSIEHGRTPLSTVEQIHNFVVYYRSGHPQFTDETHSNVKKEKRETACSLSLLVYKGHVPHYNFV